MAHYRRALEIDPRCAEAHNGLGVALRRAGRVDEAAVHFQEALRIKPEFEAAHCNLGNALADRGRLAEAIASYQQALTVMPDYAEAHNNLGNALIKEMRLDEAIAHYRRALEINPNYADAHYNLGNARNVRGEFDEAIVQYERALELNRNNANARGNLAITRLQREELLKALARQRELLRARPDDLALLNDTAWMLATDPNASIRNGAEAVALARRAVQLSKGQEPVVLGTLAAAYAEAGRFPQAIETARKVLQLATQQENRSLAKSVKAQIALYEAGTPFREMRAPQEPVNRF